MYQIKSMKMEENTLTLSSLEGSISTRLVLPDDPVAMLVLAHGAGAGISHQFMQDIQQEMGKNNIASFAFNFLYREQGKRTPFRMTNPMKAFEEVWAHVAATHDLPMFVSGKSYGGRVGSMMLDRLPSCRGLIFFGYPFHPPGKPEKLRTEHLYDITLPMLFLQGERDEFATADLVHDFVGNHEYARLIWLEDGDHSWKARKKSGFSQADHIRRAAVEVQTFCANHG